MTRQRIIASGILAILSLSGITGCITAKSGGGPVSRQEAAQIMGSDFTPADKQQKESFAQLDKSEEWLRGLNGSGASGALQMKTDYSLGKILKSGWVPSRVHYIERRSQGERSSTVFREDTTFVPGYPLVWPVWTAWSGTYMQSSGEQIGRRNAFGLGLGCFIAGRVKMAEPVTLAISDGQTPGQYNAFEIWFLAAGVLGGGRMNHYYYGQLLWVAFPVGRAD